MPKRSHSSVQYHKRLFRQTSNQTSNRYQSPPPEKAFQCATTINSTSVPVPCMTGTHQISLYLKISLQDSGNTTYLRAVDNEWQFDDAPSIVLRYSSSDPRQPLGSIAIESGVTKRNNCEVLKACLGSRKLGFDILAPIGVAFISQNNFATSCTQPRIYNL